jgi:hypothetical protein
MTAADRIIKWSTALAVFGVAAVAAVVLYVLALHRPSDDSSLNLNLEATQT